ncbi:hypothetical protein BDR06DRAFT_969387 [Suillus hirtellus]|nr:hypothetical protein BDR06DRAFT_969387 [Suillus hirtellus]
MTWAIATWSLVIFASPWQVYHSLPLSHSQNDYLRKWQYKTEDYLDLLLRREGPPLNRMCSMVHRCMPFHRISQWTRGFFEGTSLTKIGLEVHLGHKGKPCPGLTDKWCDTDDEGDNLSEGPWIPLLNDPWMTTVVDTSGLHSMMVRFCKCVGALSPDMQLFKTGLFPASFTSPKTAFTFVVLDNFLLDNLECGTSAMNYYSKSRSLVMDSNFKAEHLYPTNPSNEVALTNGLGFMASDSQYKMHLAEAQDIVQRSESHQGERYLKEVYMLYKM